MFIKQCYNDKSIQYTGGIKFVSHITDDLVTGGRRSEYSDPYLFPMDTMCRFSWQTRIPNDWEEEDLWCAIAQVKGGKPSPTIGVVLHGKNMQIVLRNDSGDNELYMKPMIKGEWMTFDVHARFTKRHNGYLNINLDGSSIVEFKGQTYRTNAQGSPYFKCGLYISSGSQVVKRCIEHRI